MLLEAFVSASAEPERLSIDAELRKAVERSLHQGRVHAGRLVYVLGPPALDRL